MDPIQDTTEPIRPPYHSQDEILQRTLDLNPTLASDIAKRLAESGYTPDQVNPPKKAGIFSALWNYVDAKYGVSKLPEDAKGLAKGATRGAAEAVNNISNTVVGMAAGATKKTGLYKVGRSPEEQQQFLEWLEQKTSVANPLSFGGKSTGVSKRRSE